MTWRKGTLVEVGLSLDTGWEAWVIPQYVKDANPGLVSVTDLPDYVDLFVQPPDSRGKARFVTCLPGLGLRAGERCEGGGLWADGLRPPAQSGFKRGSVRGPGGSLLKGRRLGGVHVAPDSTVGEVGPVHPRRASALG